MIKFPKTSEKVLGLLYEQLDVLRRVCSEKKICTFLIGGSLLGQVRHGKIIPWDDDVDVFLKKEDETKFVNAMKYFLGKNPQLNMQLWNSEHGYKLKHTLEKGVGTDIFVYNNDQDKSVFVLDRETSRNCWPRDFFLSHEIENLVFTTFGPTLFWIPNDPCRYLFNTYGNDCLKVAKLDMCHLENRPHVNRGFSVPIDKVQYE